MNKSQLLLACLSLLYLTLSTKGTVNAQDNPAHELYEKYGSIAGYIIFHFYSYFNYPTRLENRLKAMQSTGELANLCRYLPNDVSSCAKSISSSDTRETMFIVAYLNTECCNAGQQVNGNWGTWTGYSACSVSCGTGFLTRTRQCNNPPASNGGSQCFGSSNQTQTCTGPSCPGGAVNGNWGSWSTWGTCSATCGGGFRIRTRECDSPPASNGGLYCQGADTEPGQCNTESCIPIENGNWGSWSSWGACSATCGAGSQIRVRNCNNPPPSNGGSSCQGGSNEARNCSKNICGPTVVNGNWGGWGFWSSCSASCGGGSQTRIRSCNNPPPANGGATCSPANSNRETQSCAQTTCRPTVVNGNWGGWGFWSSCSASCGGGSQTRIRSCNNPPPANGGATCSPANSNRETQSCAQTTCPIHGNWGFWGTWSSCSATCGGGSQSRIRFCNNPPPSNGGASCSPSTGNRETLACAQNACAPVNGTWGVWGSWAACSATCGSGTRTRIRLCNSPAPSNGGVECDGFNSDSEFCNDRACARDCGVFKPSARIIGGQNSNPGQYPWVAMLASNGNVQCGAIVVDNWHVLTAGHCLDDKVLNNQLNSNSFEVIVGQYRRALDPLEAGAQRVFVTSGTRHQNYDQRNLLNDVAVLRLSAPLEYNENVSPVCLPTASDSLPERCRVAGWGSLSYTGSVPEVLQEVELDVYDNVVCVDTFQSTTLYDITRYVTKGVMCAANGTSGGQDSCRGDSGSSLMCRQTDSLGDYYKLFGIVSSGFGCGNKGQPGYYTYVPFYINWIETTIESLTTLAEG
ncbi:SCO-spondin-like isoform X2 [Littorina saxatilis]|uniref:SCO-spondin-like isoform X2 n=1 Tax=Littorina saxatilis TaxID=31220 RepID=UPI0038B41DD3